MSTSTTQNTKSRVVWTTDEMRFLGRRVACALMRQGINPADSHPQAVASQMIGHLQDAILCLPDHRHRSITSSGQVGWLPPIMAEMVRSSRGESDKFPANILQDYNTPTAPYYATDGIATPPPEDPEYSIPPGFSLVHEAEWASLRRRLEETDLLAKKLCRRIDHMADLLQTVMDLVIEAVPSLSPGETRPDVPSGDTVRDRKTIPIIVVAGLRKQKHAEVINAVGDLVDVVFVDPSRRPPSAVGDCHWLVITRFCASRWRDEAAKSFKGRCSFVGGDVRVVCAEIARVRGH